MINQVVCGDIDKLVNNFVEPISNNFETNKGYIHKIVTSTELLAPVPLHMDTHFKSYTPLLGDTAIF